MATNASSPTTFIQPGVCVLAVAVLLLATALPAVADSACERGDVLSPFTAQTSCSAPVSTPVVLPAQGELLQPAPNDAVGRVVYTAGSCSAEAVCADGSTVTCSSGGSSGTCSFQDSNCSQCIQGYVECDGFRTWCPSNECDLKCSQLNYPGCSYIWNPTLKCCELGLTKGDTICLETGCS